MFYEVSALFLSGLLKLVESKLPPARVTAVAFRNGAFPSRDKHPGQKLSMFVHLLLQFGTSL